ncbi:hypothetical protein LCGC14_2177760 [marine sediment metagenome]|uniref:GH29D-like beta-sandwich domain-containing protein n=1 Tax=marine sediment metagenome TaxID=412755 RepID=A0A0F9GJ03_9ZZZZ
MPIVTLTFTSSIEEIVSGVPRYMTIESNVPATIHFTVDGTTPTTDSPIYIETFEMSDGDNSVTLSAFGIDGEEISGPILTQIFAPDTTRATVSRNVGSEGFVINRPDVGPDTEDGFDADGAPARFVDVDLETLDIIRKEHGLAGIAEGTAIEVNFPDPQETASFVDDGFVPFSTPEVGELFNPEARMILIDNRKDNDIRVTLRPYGSLHNIYREFGGKRIREPADDSAYVSGGFVRRFYDGRNNVMVSYYFDHNEGRYIKNIQELPENIQSTNNMGIQPNAGRPLVFKWIYRGRHSSI